MLKKLAMLLMLPAVLWAGAIEYDLGGSFEDSLFNAHDAVTIQPAFTKTDSTGKVVQSRMPFYKWDHWYTWAAGDEYKDYTHSFGYVHNLRNTHSFKSLNSYQGKDKEWDISGTYEYMKQFGKRMSKDSLTTKLELHNIGFEPGVTYSILPDDKSFMVRGGVNYTWKKIAKGEDEYDYEPVSVQVHGRSNIASRPLEFWVVLRIEPYDILYLEMEYEGDFDGDWEYKQDPKFYVGVTGSLF